MSVSIEIDISKLESFLEKYSEDVRKEVSLELGITGREIETTYKIGVPVKTARLRSSIHTEDSNFRRFNYQNNQGELFEGNFSVRPKDDLEVIVGTNVNYASKIETLGGRGGAGQNALQNAFELHTSGLKDRINKILKP
jgi:phage gpG-like protein